MRDGTATATESADGDPMGGVGRAVTLAEEFDAFYLEEYPRMVALVYALSGNRWAAEEIAQEALLKAHRSWSRIIGYDKPGAWLRRVAVNLATSHLRRRVAEAKALARLTVGRSTPLPQHPEDEAEVWAAVARLPRRQRQVVVLHYLEGYEISDLARVLDLKPSTVKTHLQRGRHALEQALGSETEA